MKSLLLALSLACALPVWADTLSPVGQWTTYDEDTNQPESIVEIYYNKTSDTFNGKIVKPLTPPDPSKPTVCQHCEGRFEGQKIQGIEFLWGFIQSDDNPLAYQDGHVLDPRNGNEYNAKMTLSDDGSVLNFHGYMGISILGATRTWTRVMDAPTIIRTERTH